MFVFETTADGSPTVRLKLADGSHSEAMHSFEGAFSETVYIYGAAITKSFERGLCPRVLSMGLGLGYVEVLAAGLFLKAEVPVEKAGGISFELVPELCEGFRGWLLGGTSSVLDNAYDEILRLTADALEVPAAEIHTYLGKLVASGNWELAGPLSKETVWTERYGCICFDAFSSKTSPELWTEDFLNGFLTAAASETGCVLSSYACTGTLKRALRQSGFELHIRKGFSGKRDSTFAERLVSV